MNRNHYDRYELIYISTFWLFAGALKAWVNAESVIADHARNGLDFSSWEPYCWEFTSHIISFLLIPMVIVLNRRFSLTGTKPFSALAMHFLFSFLYSLLHVVGMVLLRTLVYLQMGTSYDFGDWPTEFIYEYRKDAYAYAELLVIINCYLFIIARIRGEAKIIAEGEGNGQLNVQNEGIEPHKPSTQNTERRSSDRILVKKIGKEFILKAEKIEWIEAAGNYMNMHSQGRIYPIRETMARLEKRLDEGLFVRIHRSAMVNIDCIQQIESLDSGDFQLTLKNGTQLKLSRRYREQVKQAIG
ncbi:MAG: LytTR family transcriptional regulator [Kangiellaceae bacterium]|nr:LytTR family transcriptional regulator [Kangiellaceae bacterium]